MPNDETVNVRYMVDDVETALDFYTKLFDFEVLTSAAPAFADVQRGNLRLLLSGPKSSAGRPMADGEKPGPGGWNRIHFIVDDLDDEVARLRDAAPPSATTSSKARAASRSCSSTPQATSSSSPARRPLTASGSAGATAGETWDRAHHALQGLTPHEPGDQTMATIHLHETTTATPEQFVAGLTDFGPGRSKLFPRSADDDLVVHDQGPNFADVTEGSGGIWERLRYDWSDPNRVVLTTTDSNVFGGDSGHVYTFKRNADGTTDIDVVVVREGKNVKGKVVSGAIGVVGKGVLSKALKTTVQAIEARNAAPPATG